MMMTIVDLVNKDHESSWSKVVNKLPKSGSYVVNFMNCILNIHILPIHVKTHNTVYGFHELFLSSLKQHEHGTDSFSWAYPPLPKKNNRKHKI